MTSPYIDIYCLSHKNDKRKDRIAKMFEKHNLPVEFYGGVDFNYDPRIAGRPLDENTKRCWSIMYGHLDMIRRFVAGDKEVAIFCEDDITIRKDFSKYLPHIISNFHELGLDMLLLGNICTNPEFRKFSNFPELPISDNSAHPFQYYAYNSNPESGVWGTQMYMLRRSQALVLLEQYSNGYADKTISDKSMIPFASDWTITKGGKKALTYPLIAIELIESYYADLGQDYCRKRCYELHYSAEVFE